MSPRAPQPAPTGDWGWLSAIPEPALVLDSRGQCRAGNARGLDWWDLGALGAETTWQTLVHHTLQQGEVGLNWVSASPAGAGAEERTSVVRLRPLPHEGSEPLVLVTVACDPSVDAIDQSAIFTLSPLPMWIYEVESLRFLAVNQAAVERYGYSLAEFRSLTLRDIRPSEDIPRLISQVRVVGSGFDDCGVWRHLTRSGEQMYVHILTHRMGFQGKLVDLVLVLDQTESHHQREALEQREARFRSLVENGFDVIVVVNEEGRREYVSPNYEAKLGRSPTEALGGSVLDAVHPSDRPRAAREVVRLKESPNEPRSITLRIRTGEGYRWMDVVATNRLADPMIRGFVLNARDVTERHAAEAALSLSEQRLELALDGAGMGCWSWDIVRRLATFDARSAHQLGYELDEFQQESVYGATIHPDDRGWMGRLGQELYDNGQANIDITLRSIKKDGSDVWIRSIGRVVEWDRNGRPTRAVGIRMDVTAARRANLVLAESERRYRFLAENATDVILRLAADGTIRFASPTIATYTGLGPEQAVGKDFLALVAPEDRPEFARTFSALFPNHSQTSILFRLQQGETTVWMEAAARAIAAEDPREPEVVLIARDTEARLQAEETVRRSELRWRRMMENLPGGVALIQEDRVLFNQTVAEITGYAPDEIVSLEDWFQRAFDEPDRAREVYRAARDAGFPRALTHWIRRRDGTYRFVEMAGFTDDVGEVWLLHDVTDQRRAEDRLRRQNDELNAVRRVQSVLLETDHTDTIHEVILRQTALLTGTDQGFLIELESPASSGEPPVRRFQSQWVSRGSEPKFRFGDAATEVPGLHLERNPQGSWAIRCDDDHVEWTLLTHGEHLVGALGQRPHRRGTPVTAPWEAFWGTVAQALQIIQDHRRRQRLELSAKTQAQVLAQVQEAVISVDLDGRISSWNQGASRMFGFTEEEAVGLPLSILFPTSPRRSVEHQAALALARHPSYALETAMVTKRFEVFYARAQFTHLRSDAGEVIGTIFYAFDVTERRKAELRVRQLNQKLEDRVRRRTHELESAVRELEAFTYTVSHDLRSPLRAISGYANLLIEETGGSLSAEASDLLVSIDRNAIRMGQLIDDLLRLSRLGRQSLDQRLVNLNTLVDEVLAQLEHEVGDRRVEFVRDNLPSVYGDAALLGIVWTNLLSNALKFTRNCPEARIEIRTMAEPDGIALGVVDNGDGFDMRYSGKLFTVFQRLHSQRDFEGTGVGLAIVKRIVERHGGRVWAVSQPGEGAAFWFTLPRRMPEDESIIDRR